MEHYIDIAAVDNAAEAQLLETILKERQIPYLIQSHQADSGEFKTAESSKSGVITAPEEYRRMILYIIADIRKNASRVLE